jgi:hypothetical protein
MTTTAASKGLMLHTGGYAVDRSRVLQVPTPPPTDTHYPVPHDFLLQTIDGILAEQGYTVVDQAHALWGSAGERYFGIYTLAGNDLPTAQGTNGTARWDYVLGIRNAHDKSFSASGCMGTHMGTVCDNLAWWGWDMFRFARKHSRFIRRDLPGVVYNELGRISQVVTNIEARNDAYKAYSFKEPRDDTMQDTFAGRPVESVRANDFFIRALKAKATTAQRLPKLIAEWEREDGCGGHSHYPEFCEPTAFRMMQCFTETEKASPSLLEGPRRNNRLVALLDAQCGIKSITGDTADVAVTEYND